MNRARHHAAQALGDRLQHCFLHRARELLAELLRLREERVEQARCLAFGLQTFDLEPVEFGVPLAPPLGGDAGTSGPIRRRGVRPVVWPLY